MSTVHIVLGAPKEELIKPLIEQEGLVIGVDRGALFALKENIKVDIALGDFDSVTKDEMKWINERAKQRLSFPSDKDDTDTELALLYALELGDDVQIFLYNWYGGRIDHLYSILLLAHQERFKPLIDRLQLVSSKNNIAYYLPGEHAVEKMERMKYLSYVLLTEVKDLSLNNVKYELAEKSFNGPVALVSNEFLEDKANFSFKEGIVAVIQSID